MTAVFLSYRRDDTMGYAGRLADALEARFGQGAVFHDVETVAPGRDFTAAIEEGIARCAVFLVLIGDTWLTAVDGEGRRRLEDPHDYVRLEVRAALRRGLPILPVLVEGARMPGADDLPDDLRPLHRLQAVDLSGSRWDYDVERLSAAIDRVARASLPRRRRFAALAAAALAGLAAVLGAVLFFSERPPDLAGRWDLPNGSYWTVVQDGRAVTIEETHYDSRQVWKRGRGALDAARLDFALELVYDQGRYEGRLRLSDDGSTLSGEVADLRRGSRSPLVLTRVR